MFREHLENFFDQNGFDDEVSYKQWVKEKKFKNLTSNQMIVTELIEKLCTTTFDKLRPHHYVNKAQSCRLKANLKQNECIILLDFEENFTYVV